MEMTYPIEDNDISDDGIKSNSEEELEADPEEPENRPNANFKNNQSVSTLKGNLTALEKIKSSQLSKSKSISNKSFSDSDESEKDAKNVKAFNEYNPIHYQNLDVDSEIKDLFQYIIKYMPQQLTLDYKFKPFTPDYLPGVGDIDAFLKVIPPNPTLSGENFDIPEQQLGFAILDEPATIQSDSALLHLQLRADSSVVTEDYKNVVVKKVENIQKNRKVIDKWIKDISDLHKSKSSAIIRYAEPMPDIDDLMQEWSEEMESRLNEHGFPMPDSNMSTSEYLELICDMFQIPFNANKIHSLHLLFCLYAAVKNSKLYQANIVSDKKIVKKEKQENDVADQLLIE